MPSCVRVRLFHGREPKLYAMRFKGEPPAVGTRVVARTPRGLELGEVRGGPYEVEKSFGEVVRAATEDDLERVHRFREKEESLKWWLRARLRPKLPQVKVLGCSYTLDGGHVVVYYSAEQRVNLGSVVREIARHAGARVEFVAKGPRDQTAFLGTLGMCGMESCCSTWMQHFAPATIRMARDQQLPLSPEKISGPCGRLLCCLAYEHPHYKELLAGMPKKNAKVCTSAGVCGKVVKLNPLAGTVDLYTEGGGVITAPASDLRPREPKE
ncbi:regulatory iron-sulfur-containing complex subunit RicT [Oceanithermus sp.]|uniref:PSP1 domain-containing protein n=1 Tax=Oceanithermus sp. TaxID=2268145 RepID=UPI0025D65EEF|nr:regulatory iron-sulfur-containing complex subunit RicT [Oceanithermus sp.]